MRPKRTRPKYRQQSAALKLRKIARAFPVVARPRTEPVDPPPVPFESDELEDELELFDELELEGAGVGDCEGLGRQLYVVFLAR